MFSPRGGLPGSSLFITRPPQAFASFPVSGPELRLGEGELRRALSLAALPSEHPEAWEPASGCLPRARGWGAVWRWSGK